MKTHPLIHLLAIGFLVVGGFHLRSFQIRLSKAHANQPLSFATSVPKKDIVLPVKVEQTDYKATRAKEICQMATEYGLSDHCELLIAHLLTECGSMTEYCDWTPGKKSNDHGWAFGIAQWHLYYREEAWLKANGFTYPTSDVTRVRDKFFADHPELRDWRGQARRYLTELRDCAKDKTIERCIDDWNAHWFYMTKVKSKLPSARKLLGDFQASKPHYLVIHHTTVTREIQAQAVENSHAKRYGESPDTHSHIAYHYLIGKDGTVKKNRSESERTGHTSCDVRYPKLCKNGHTAINQDSIAIVLAGDFDFEQPTEAQMKAFRTLVAALRTKYDIPADHVIPHKEASATACPGKNLIALLAPTYVAFR